MIKTEIHIPALPTHLLSLFDFLNSETTKLNIIIKRNQHFAAMYAYVCI